MKKGLKILGVSIGLIVLLIGIVVIFISANDIPSYDVEKIDFKVNSSPEALARGEKLAVMLCASCHLNHQTNKLTGQKMMDAPPNLEKSIPRTSPRTRPMALGTGRMGNWYTSLERA